MIRRKRGFTLLEALIAMAVGTLVIQGARLLMDALVNTQSTIREEGGTIDRRANAHALLRALVRQLRTNTVDDTIAVDSVSVRFTSSCETKYGWLERCRATISLVRIEKEIRILVHTGALQTFDVAFDSITGPILFLEQSGDIRSWQTSPGSRVSAVGIVRHRDTLLLPVGGQQ